jgi:hypothetical protein
MRDDRRYVSDDHDIDEEPMELSVSQGENGDWYMTIAPKGTRLTRHCVRIDAPAIPDEPVPFPSGEQPAMKRRASKKKATDG